MKKTLSISLLLLSCCVVTLAQKSTKRELTVILLDHETISNSINNKSKLLLGTGIIYSQSLNDIFDLQLGVSAYEAVINDFCRFCFDFDTGGKGLSKKREIRVGLGYDETILAFPKLSLHIASVLSYGYNHYQGVFVDSFSGSRFGRNITSHYISTGIDLGFKVRPSPNLVIVVISNVSVINGLTTHHIQNFKFNTIELLPNILEVRMGMAF